MLIGCRTAGHHGPSRTEAPSPLDQGAATGSPPPRDGGFAAVSQDAEPAQIVCSDGTMATCTDPYNCTCGNGTGVYAVEGGFAGITVRTASEPQGGPGEQIIMITHFINNASGSNVTFEYGTFVLSAVGSATNQWTWQPLGIGNVDSADYGAQTNLTAILVRETNTVPIWMLRTLGTGALQSVTDLQRLKLHISFKVPGVAALKMVTLDFHGSGTNTLGGNVIQKLTEYRMRWQNLSDFPAASPQQYCHGSSKQPDDMVVFQQGIDVDPMSGTVKRPDPKLNPNPANVVTVSCSLGAPAMVYSWGYPYQGLDADPDTFYFDAGIHMKRASYCGDARYYTTAGTMIHISDSKGLHGDVPNPSGNPGVEAWWGRRGAVCVNSEHMRHPEMAPTDIELMTCGGQPYKIGNPLQGCSFVCNGGSLPACPPGPPPPQLLVDRP